VSKVQDGVGPGKEEQITQMVVSTIKTFDLRRHI